MSAFFAAATVWLADFLIFATLLMAGALLLRPVFRQPAARVTLAWSTWLGILALAVLTALPAWPRVAIADVAAMFRNSTAAEAIEQSAGLSLRDEGAVVTETLVDATLATDPLLVAPADSRSADGFRPALAWPQFALAAWAIIAIASVSWIGLGWLQAVRLIARAAQAPRWVVTELQRLVGAARLPGIWSSQKVNTAVALGAWSPQIVLPQESVAETNAPAIRAALAHEWAHIRHGDLWLLALERLLLPLLAAHPLFWWLRRSVRLDQELLADAAAAGDEPAEYAQALLVWARMDKTARHGLAALSMWEHPSTLSRRVAMILDSKHRVAKPLNRMWTMLTVALMIPAVLGGSVVSLQPSTAQEQPAESEAEQPIPLTRLPAEASPLPTAGNSVPITQVHLGLVLLSVNRDKLAAADTTLEDAIAAATESRCRKEAGLVVSEIKPEEVVKLLEELKKHEAATVLSRPHIVTLDGREAHLHIGGEAPILRVEETINGTHEQRVEYKEFGTLLTVRPRLNAKERGEVVALDIVAEQSTLLPPGEKAEEGAVPRDVPGLVSHKFKLTSDVRLGASLLVAESPANKKQLRDAVKQQFLLIVTPERAVKTVAAVYADPREGDKGEAARKATEAALEAATAAEPEPGTAAAALLKRERDLRAKETADLQRRIELLERALAERQANPLPASERKEQRMEARVFRMREGDAREHKARFDELLAKSPVATQKIAVNFKGDLAEVHAPAELMGAVAKIMEAIGAEKPGAETSTTVYRLRFVESATVADRLKEFLAKSSASDAKVAVDAATNSVIVAAQPQHHADIKKLITALDRPEENRALQTELKLLELDLAEAKLSVEEAEEEYSRVQELKATNSISQQEVRQKQLAVERAKIQLQRIMVKLEAAKSKAEPAPK